MTELIPAAASVPSGEPAERFRRSAATARQPAWLPTRGLIATRLLELRRRRGLMAAVMVLIVGPPVLILSIRYLAHVIDPKANPSPPGSPALFTPITGLVAEFGFLVAAALGASAGTTDLTDGMFRHLVITGRSRIALYLARIPAGLSIIVPVVAASFAILCLVTCLAGSPQPSSVGVNGVTVPAHLDHSQLHAWAEQHPAQVITAITGPGPGARPAPNVSTHFSSDLPAFSSDYATAEAGQLNPPVNEMIKIGLWLELEIGMGFMVGLGLGSLIGQRVLPTILLIALEIVVTPILSAHAIPYFLDGQRLDLGVAMNQLKPVWLSSGQGGPGLFGGHGPVQIPPMPTWAMISVIVGWLVVWSVLGAWRMVTRDA